MTPIIDVLKKKCSSVTVENVKHDINWEEVNIGNSAVYQASFDLSCKAENNFATELGVRIAIDQSIGIRDSYLLATKSVKYKDKSTVQISLKFPASTILEMSTLFSDQKSQPSVVPLSFFSQEKTTGDVKPSTPAMPYYKQPIVLCYNQPK